MKKNKKEHDAKVAQLKKLELTRRLFREGTKGYQNLSRQIATAYRELGQLEGVEPHSREPLFMPGIGGRDFRFGNRIVHRMGYF